jgi:mannose-6-phosphate isomerase
MGTHPNGPSVIKKTGEDLAQWIRQHPESLGDSGHRQNQLQYLFKVLSVNIALSIQVHPDKVTNELLNQ